MRPASLFAIALLASTALAGCSEDKGASDDAAPEPERPPLHGWVLDVALRPLAGVKVQVLETNGTTVTDAEGYYGFDDVPTERFLVLVAALDGYETTSKQVTLPAEGIVRLNFTMVQVPFKQAYMEILPFDGFIPCQAMVEVAEQQIPFDCSGGEGVLDVWEFSVSPELAGAVIEIVWEPVTPLAESFGARLETLGLGDLNVVMSEAKGVSILRLTVAKEVAEKYYAGGGIMRLTVFAMPLTDENEVGAGAAVAVQQPFQAFASMFYIEGPDPTYTVGSGA